MREIKFRAWDNKRKAFRPDDLIAMTGHGDILNWYTEEGFKDITERGDAKRFIVQLYTGLKDKKGKEIYEGDILGSEHFNNAEVLFMNGAFFCGDHDLFDVASGYYGDCLMVGNVYENPELLT